MYLYSEWVIIYLKIIFHGISSFIQRQTFLDIIKVKIKHLESSYFSCQLKSEEIILRLHSFTPSPFIYSSITPVALSYPSHWIVLAPCQLITGTLPEIDCYFSCSQGHEIFIPDQRAFLRAVSIVKHREKDSVGLKKNKTRRTWLAIPNGANLILQMTSNSESNSNKETSVILGTSKTLHPDRGPPKTRFHFNIIGSLPFSCSLSHAQRAELSWDGYNPDVMILTERTRGWRQGNGSAN